MSEMVERVAEAIRLRSIERGHPIHPAAVRHLAIASLEAMRRPTEEMAIAGRQTSLYPARTFAAMIDAALTPAKVDEAR